MHMRSLNVVSMVIKYSFTIRGPQIKLNRKEKKKKVRIMFYDVAIIVNLAAHTCMIKTINSDSFLSKISMSIIIVHAVSLIHF